MAKVRIIEYEGTEEEIRRLMMHGTPQLHSASPVPSNGSRNGGANSSVWEDIAKKFHKHISDTAAWGLGSQNKAMLAWLKRDGEIDLTTLWKAAGVKTQHHFGGVGGSLTKNMQKAGGPREWYRAAKNDNGQWIYTIVDELVEPLKTAFGI
jgi:hypothetical protein